jgi:hypothetical protein
MNKKLRVAAYCRVGSVSQKDEHCYDKQKEHYDSLLHGMIQRVAEEESRTKARASRAGMTTTTTV